MSAARLREAATLLRERAEEAAGGPWDLGLFPGDHERPESHRSFRVLGHTGRVADDLGRANAVYIATMHPPVALALADWLDVIVDDVEDAVERTINDYHGNLDAAAIVAYEHGWLTSHPALDVADAILGDRS